MNIQLMLVFLLLQSWSCTFPTVHNGLPDDIIHNIAICADDTTLYFMFDQASEKAC